MARCWSTAAIIAAVMISIVRAVEVVAVALFAVSGGEAGDGTRSRRREMRGGTAASHYNPAPWRDKYDILLAYVPFVVRVSGEGVAKSRCPKLP